MGLIQRAIEKEGIPTIAISIMRKLTEDVKSPRAVFLKWPMGHPLGEPDNAWQHTAVLKSAFTALETITAPGTIIDLPYRWRRHEDIKVKMFP